ncbi:MAG TPA: class I SAM-dependent methyltransferase [Roseiarcus sp.]|jgi:S-adenosylmethionine-diacylgycerolhomoserine-N-methlytransferase
MNDAAALMDRMYRRQRHIYDATRKFYLLGRDATIAELAAPAGGGILEIGCGTGRNLVKIARRYPEADVFGLDVSSEMLVSARASIERAGLAPRIRVALADATNFDAATLFGRPNFERVVISYALSMIPPWREALAQAVEALAPGGALHIVDFGDQAGLPAAFRAGLVRWLAAFDVTPRTTLRAELAAVAGSRGLRWAARDHMRGYAIRAVVERPAA